MARTAGRRGGRLSPQESLQAFGTMTSFRSFVFMNIAGCTLDFENRNSKLETGGMCRPQSRLDVKSGKHLAQGSGNHGLSAKLRANRGLFHDI